MAQKCFVCDDKTIFYVWSTGRNFPWEQLVKIKGIREKRTIRNIKNHGFPVCFDCLEKLKNKEKI